MDSAERVSRKRKSCEMEGETTTSASDKEVMNAQNDNQQAQQDSQKCEDSIARENKLADVANAEKIDYDSNEGNAGSVPEDKAKGIPEDKPESVIEDEPENVIEDKPECVIGNQPECVIRNQLEAVIGNKSECVIGNQPECGIGNQPECGIGIRPECVIGNQLESVMGNQPECVIGNKPECVIGNQLESVLGNQPECGIRNKPECAIEEKAESLIEEKSKLNEGKPKDDDKSENANKDHFENTQKGKAEGVNYKPEDGINVYVDKNDRNQKVNYDILEGLKEMKPENKCNIVDKHAEQPVITITFSGADLKTYKPSFLNFLRAFPDLKIVDSNNVVRVFKCAPLEVTTSTSKRSKRKKKKARKELFSIEENPTHVGEDDEADSGHKRSKWEPFVVDANPTEVEGNEKDRVKFSSKFKVLEEDKTDEKKEGKAESGLGTCFNCDGRHSIRDCQEPKDFARIRQAKMNFRSNAQKLTRYHVDEDKNFSNLKPGKLSTKLRDALGLGKYELPPHIYKMRVLGYPPGWLEEAKIVRSNITMFDIEGKNVREKATSNKNFIDPEKIVNYEGFNVKMERGFRDQCQQYGVPPFSKNHAKEAMITFINNMIVNMEDNLETCDMDIDASSDKEEDTTTKSPRISPTLTDLELKKKQLLVELVDAECIDSTGTEPLVNKKPLVVLDSSECDNTAENKEPADDSTENKPLAVDSEHTEVADSELDDSKRSPDLNKQQNGESSADPGPLKLVKNSTFGTPILKSGSPYSRLPNPDNFMKDVSPVINYENLPNSTGKYKQMTGVLERVRKTLKNIQEET